MIIRAQERKATLMGDNSPRKVDPIQLAAETGPQLNSTEKMRVVLENFLGQDKKRLINGGAGYGEWSWQDIQDREAMAERVARGEPATRGEPLYDPGDD